MGRPAPLSARRLVLAAMLLPAVASADWESSLLPRGFTHEPSLPKAVARAAAERKAVILYYTRTQCPPCNVLQARLRKDAVGGVLRPHYVFTAVWGNSMGRSEREHFRSRFDVQGAPTWLVFNASGQYLCTSRGGLGSDEDAQALHERVQQLLQASAPEPATPIDCLPGR